MFLTGALGYTGTIICHKLIENGFDVVGCDATYFPDECFCRDDAYQSRQEMSRLLVKDIRDITVDDLRGCDAVVDYSGLANDPTSELNLDWTEEINYRAPVRLATLAKRLGLSRYVFASSCAVYGARGKQIVTEETKVAPVSAYAASKAMAERKIRLLSDRDFSPILLRNATVFGCSPRMRFDLVVNNLAGYAHTTGVIRVMSDGTAWRPNVHVDDVGSAIVGLLEAPKDAINNEVFNVGADSQNLQVREIAMITSEVFANSKVEYAPSLVKDPRSYKVSFKKIQAVLRSSPSWTVRKGLQELREAFAINKLNVKTFSGAKYHNLSWMKYLLETGQVDSSLRRKKS